MEFVAIKRNRGRKTRKHLKKRRREQRKLEVIPEKRRGHVSERTNIFIAKGKLINNTMHANSFWENYSAAQEWQKRHSITWWRTRCIALEHENQILRDKLRSLVYRYDQADSQCVPWNKGRRPRDLEMENENENETVFSEEADNLEFHVNEDMMSFLEQSMRHKIELKKKKESESVIDKRMNEEGDASIQGGASWIHTRNRNAKLLYGEASPTILAMETALQTTVDRHKDKTKPQYWPIIPLKP